MREAERSGDLLQNAINRTALSLPRLQYGFPCCNKMLLSLHQCVFLLMEMVKLRHYLSILSPRAIRFTGLTEQGRLCADTFS